jgi:hypothetical protein
VSELPLIILILAAQASESEIETPDQLRPREVQDATLVASRLVSHLLRRCLGLVPSAHPDLPTIALTSINV